MNRKREKDEHIEQLYYMKEDGTNSIAALKNAMNEHYDTLIIDELALEDMINRTPLAPLGPRGERRSFC